MSRQNYTVLIGYPTGGGHYATKGQTLDLLDVQARALRTAGRIELTSVIDAAAAAAKAATVAPEASAIEAPAKTTKAAKAATKDA